MTIRKMVRKNRRTGKTVTVYDIDIVYRAPGSRKRQRERKRFVGKRREWVEEYERRMLAELLAGTYGKEPDAEKEIPTFEKFSSDFIESYVVPHNKPSEQENKRMHLRVHLLPFFGDKRLDAIGPADFDKYTAEKLRAKLGHKTINMHLSTLRRALVLAQEWGLLEMVPPIRRLKEAKPEFRFLDFDEADRLVEGAAPEWRAMIVLGLKTGMRLGELLAVRWEDVDLQTGRVMVRRNYVRGKIGTPKSGKAREIPLSDEAIAALKKHRHLRGELVFCDEKGEFLSKGETKHPLWRACKKATIERIGWHVLRHTFASHLAMRGAPAKAIQELMGHSTIEMTMRYMHLSPDARRDAVKLLDKRGGRRVNRVSTRIAKDSK